MNLKFIKRRLILFSLCLSFSFFFFLMTDEPKADDPAWENAYIACLIDERTHTYKYQVIYSGVQVEYNNVTGMISNAALNVDEGRLSLYEFTQYSDVEMMGYLDAATGKFVTDYEIINAGELGSGLISKEGYHPLSFPGYSGKFNATAADINRAYSVMDAICGDFSDALLFINDGKAYESTDTLIQTAYFLCTAGNSGSQIVNQYGTTYDITYNTTPKDGTNGYLYECVIKREDGTKETFNYKIKKGYADCSYGEAMENGDANTLRTDDSNSVEGVEEEIASISDTVYVTWEHLFLEAGVLYATGITYSNQADLYSVSDMESSLLELTRNLLGGIKNILQLYSMEECIFNLGVRGSSAFSYGVFNSGWTSNIMILYLIFTGITISGISISILCLILKKQISTINPTMRVSLMAGFQNILISVFFMGAGILLIQFFMLFNQEFVEIFATLADGNTLRDKNNVYSNLAAIILQFAFLIIDIYVNYVYIIRGLLVPALMALASPAIYCYSLGPRGQQLTKSYIKELLSLIFIQSIHAFCYGFILMSSNGLRGIESIIVCVSIIPLTSIIKSTFGVGADGLIKAATGSTVATAAMGSAAVSGIAGTLSAVTPAPVGMVANAGAGIFSAGMGSGMMSIGEPMSNIQGTHMMQQGLSVNEYKLKQSLRDSGQFFSDAKDGYVKAAGKVKDKFRIGNRESSSSSSFFDSNSGSMGGTSGTSSGGNIPNIGRLSEGGKGNGASYSQTYNNVSSGVEKDNSVGRNFYSMKNDNNIPGKNKSNITETFNNLNVPSYEDDNVAAHTPSFQELRQRDNCSTAEFSKKYSIPYTKVKLYEQEGSQAPMSIINSVVQQMDANNV